jgi:hypothetical protein
MKEEFVGLGRGRVCWPRAFWKMIFWFVLKLEIRYRVIIFF